MPDDDKIKSDLLAQLDAVFEPSDWAVRVESKPAGYSIEDSRDSRADFRPDRIYDRRESILVVQLKMLAGRVRHELLRAWLAAAILEARQLAGEHANALPLAVVGAEHLTARSIANITGYAERFADGVAWGLVDRSGVRVLRGAGLPELSRRSSNHQVDERHRSNIEVHRQPANPFTDLGQWLLKVMLGAQLDDLWIQHAGAGEALRTVPRTATDLAQRARISSPVVSVLLSGLEHRGFLKRRPALQLVDRHRLFQEWLAAANARPCHEIKARRRFGASPAIDVVTKRLSEGSKLRSDACLGLFSACRVHGVDWVGGAPEYVLARSLDDARLASLGLRPTRAGEVSEIIVRKPRFPESAFRAIPAAGVSIADGIQCWLDVRHHAARGKDLATELWHAMGFDFPEP